jgi:hypothetical protein
VARRGSGYLGTCRPHQRVVGAAEKDRVGQEGGGLMLPHGSEQLRYLQGAAVGGVGSTTGRHNVVGPDNQVQPC